MKRYLQVTSGTFSDIIRSGMALDYLQNTKKINYDYAPIFRFDKKLMDNFYNAAIVSRPMDARLVRMLRSKGTPVIVDYDDDFEEIPKHHVAYDSIGKGNPAALEQMRLCIEIADAVTVSTEVLKERFEERYGRKIHLVHNGWSSNNENWKRKIIRDNDHKVVIGWSGTQTHQVDFMLVRKALEYTLEKNPEIMIAIGGDPEIYEMFSTSREDQKIFIPAVSYERYPLVIGMFDILIAPLQDNKFNQAKSEIKLIDAGAKSIPWIASPSCAYQRWNDGGVFASNIDEWMSAFVSLAYDPKFRSKLGKEGYRKSEKRTVENIAKVWENVIKTVEI